MLHHVNTTAHGDFAIPQAKLKNTFSSFVGVAAGRKPRSILERLYVWIKSKSDHAPPVIEAGKTARGSAF
jgi:hypothetical protein